MKKLLLTGISIFLLYQVVQSQNFVNEFGKCSNDELQMNQYSKDSLAEAVVIYDIGRSYFKMTESGLMLIFEKSTKIKIFNKAGIGAAEFKIPYFERNSRGESILELEGNTYNYENGKIRSTPFDPKNSYEEKTENGWKFLKFAMPDVKEGSVIEVKYSISSPYFFNFRDWSFQSNIPVIYSEYKAQMVPFYDYRFILQGTNKLSETRSYKDNVSRQLGGYTWQDMVYVYIMKDVPAFRDESFISAPDDYRIQIEFQLSKYINSFESKEEILTTWPKLIKEMMDDESFGDYAKSAQKQAKSIIDTMHLEAKSAKEKAEKIFNYVKTNFNWNNSSRIYSTGTVKEFLQSKEGNCTSINLFLLGMLNSAGLDAYPVLISTRGHGKIKYDYPFINFFNYTIVAVNIDGKRILLDATEPLCAFGMLPSRCLNDAGIAIKKGDEPEWVKFSSSVFSSSTYSFDLKLNIEKDSMLANIKILSSGYEGLNLRKKYLKYRADFKDEVLLKSHILVDSIKVENLDNIGKLFSIELNVKKGYDLIDKKILVSPFCGYVINRNPLKQPTRSYPIDMTYKKRNVYMSTIHIPEGFKILSKPDGITIDNNDVKITYMSEIVNNNTVRLVGIYEFSRDVYEASKYLELKKYFDTIIDKFNEKLVLVKI